MVFNVDLLISGFMGDLWFYVDLLTSGFMRDLWFLMWIF